MNNYILVFSKPQRSNLINISFYSKLRIRLRLFAAIEKCNYENIVTLRKYTCQSIFMSAIIQASIWVFWGNVINTFFETVAPSFGVFMDVVISIALTQLLSYFILVLIDMLFHVIGYINVIISKVTTILN